MKRIKRTGLLCVYIMCIFLFTACEDEKHTLTAGNSANGEKIHDNIEAGDTSQVNISGNARSIVIKQSNNNSFEFYNADLNAGHKYEVSCDRNGKTLNISIMMENPEADNNILGSIVVYVPQKEFEKIEADGEFKSISFYVLNSDVFIHADKSSVILNLAAEQLEHNITLEGSESNAFREVSVYFDKLPDNITMDCSTVQNGRIDDTQGLLKNGSLITGSGKPVISIRHTERINIYVEETS